MTAPTITGAAAYYAAQEALKALLDASDNPWENAIILLSRAATSRRATIIEAALWKARFEGLEKSAKFQDLADKMTDPPAAEDRQIDAEVKEFFNNADAASDSAMDQFFQEDR